MSASLGARKRNSVRRYLGALAVVLATFAAPRAANAENSERAAIDANDAIDRTARAAYSEKAYAFCNNPARPLGVRQRALCPLAAEVQGCEALVDACGRSERRKDDGWFERVIAWLAPVARVLLYLVLLGIAVVIAIPVVRVLLARRRSGELARRVSEATNHALVASPTPAAAESVSDAEADLRLAEEHRTRGELKEALGLYLSASLAALERRGTIRRAPYRTNGEYVRACRDESLREPLFEIVREVDKVEFGGAEPSDDGLAKVASRAKTIVDMAKSAVVLAIALLSLGCSTPQKGADPAGDELPIDVLTRNGFDVRALGTSLSTMPLPDEDEVSPPVVILDAEKVSLEEEAQAHILRWVEAGGVLIVFGSPASWPKALGSTKSIAQSRDLVVSVRSESDDDEETDDEDDNEPIVEERITVRGARVARTDAFAWSPEGWLDSETVAFLGEDTYAAKRRVGKGLVLGVANDDLFTNLGMMPPHNAAALVTLVRAVAYAPERIVAPGAMSAEGLSAIRVARRQDGISPPADPFSALLAAGLGKGAWHALAAAIVLFLAYGIRHARPRAPEPQERRAFVEHVEAAGALYARARAHSHALAAYGRFMEARLRESLPRTFAEARGQERRKWVGGRG
ncbi:MAG TPA: DUF4350 domain-containing protein, partial [Labilithrix sp.]|nr:DUF4350 domain-containing protein [Labilithrix sp.]